MLLPSESPTPASPGIVSLSNVSKRYDAPGERGPGTGFAALSHVDLEIAARELVAVVGKSGSGKSTLLNVMGGIDAASAGGVVAVGERLSALSPSALARWRGENVGFVFQFFQLLPTLTVVENVMLPMDFCRRFAPRERRRRALDLLARVRVAEQADKLPAALSGGQLQRAAIARALANGPSLVLADEPTGNLDSGTAEEVLGLFRELASDGAAVVLATHERDIARIADRIVELADGAVVSDRPGEARLASAESAR